MNEFSIAGRKIGPDHPPLVIAEVGINHEGANWSMPQPSSVPSW